MRFWFLLFVFALSAHGQTVRGGKSTVGGQIGPQSSLTVSQSNTQMLLTYTAPDANPCQAEVSQSPSYSPLVLDVDPAVFGAGANLDSRAGSLIAGTAHTFVIGEASGAVIAEGAFLYAERLQRLNPEAVRKPTCRHNGAAWKITRPGFVSVACAIKRSVKWIAPTKDLRSRRKTLRRVNCQRSPVGRAPTPRLYPFRANRHERCPLVA